MAGLTALLAASQGLQAASGLAGSFSQAGAIRAQGRYERASLDVNARMAELQAQDALQRGDQEAGAIRRQGKAFMGAQRARIAASGVTGETPNALMGETALIAGMDADQARSNASMQAWGFQQQANDYRRQGELVRKASKTNARATLLTGGLQFVQGMGQTAGTLDKLRQEKTQQALYRKAGGAANSAFRAASRWTGGGY